jgi:dihydroorotate dehydrogenase
VVLIGKYTSERDWVRYEIERAYKLGKGIVGVYINKLEDQNKEQSDKGSNPFYNIFTDNNHRLSEYVECFESAYFSSSYVYADIKKNLPIFIERAIDKQGTY